MNKDLYRLTNPVADTNGSVEDETLIEDRRASIRPAISVEEKLIATLETGPVFLSHLQRLLKPHDR